MMLNTVLRCAGRTGGYQYFLQTYHFIRITDNGLQITLCFTVPTLHKEALAA